MNGEFVMSCIKNMGHYNPSVKCRNQARERCQSDQLSTTMPSQPRYHLLNPGKTPIYHRITAFIAANAHNRSIQIATFAILCVVGLLFVFPRGGGGHGDVVTSPGVEVATELLAGIPGFWVLKNVWYKDRKFCESGLRL